MACQDEQARITILGRMAIVLPLAWSSAPCRLVEKIEGCGIKTHKSYCRISN